MVVEEVAEIETGPQGAGEVMRYVRVRVCECECIRACANFFFSENCRVVKYTRARVHPHTHTHAHTRTRTHLILCDWSKIHTHTHTHTHTPPTHTHTYARTQVPVLHMLKTLTLCDCTTLSPDAVKGVLKLAPHLQSLDLEGVCVRMPYVYV